MLSGHLMNRAAPAEPLSKLTTPQENRSISMSSAIVAGVGITAAALTGRWFLRTLSKMKQTARITGGSPFIHYYQGGFENGQKMSRREANLILGLREGAAKEAIRDAHRRIMIANHPDRGGSPYLASKVNEAKAILDNK